MNQTEDDLAKDYRNQQWKYEEQEDALWRKRNREIDILEEVTDKTRYYMKDFIDDDEYIIQGVQALDKMKEEVDELAESERKRIRQQMDDLEDDYDQKRRHLFQ